MLTKFENNRLQLLPEDPEEIVFCDRLLHRITDSNRLLSWYGDVRFNDKETSGYVITEKPKSKKE